MFENIPIQTRLKVILGIIMLVFILELVYLNQTVSLFKELKVMEAKTSGIENAEQTTLNYQVRLKELDKEIQKGQSRSQKITSHIEFLEYLDALCAQNAVKLISLPLENIEELEGYKLATIDFKLQGNFTDILKLVNQAEDKDKVASVASFRMDRENVRIKNRRTEILTAGIKVNRLLDSQ